MQFPLFQGMSQDDLTKIVGYVKFDFIKVERGKAVMHENDICDHLYFMLNGILEVRTPACDHGYTFVEHIHAPYTIQPERIFGLIQHYSHDFIAEETCGFVRIDKEEILKLSDNYFIFKLNLLNLLSREVQVCAREPWKSVPKNLEERIVRFIGQRCIRPAGRKEIFIKMTRLAEELNDSRLDVSIALNHLQDKGLIQLSRGKITVPAMEDLLK